MSGTSFRGETTGDEAEDFDEIQCALCKETLSLDNYYSNPFGQFAYVSNSKLLYHAYKQALTQSQEVKEKQEPAEELKASEIDEKEESMPEDPMENL